MSRLHDYLTGRIKKPEPKLENEVVTFEQMLASMERQSRRAVRKP